MPVNLNLPQAYPVEGLKLATLSAGIKNDGSADLVVMSVAEHSSCAAVFTKNAFCAAPVTLCREQMLSSEGCVRALLINSGNANAGTGEPGMRMTRQHCEAVSEALSIPQNSVLPFSTGVIGQLLPHEIMLAGIEKASEQLKSSEVESLEAWQEAASGIMTTDTVPKLSSQKVTVAGQSVTITGMAKGSGMIQPDMATMLSYVFTDANVDYDDLQHALTQAVDVSFNVITVDSDTSTNDACVLIATGASIAEKQKLNRDHADWPVFMAALIRLCVDLAQAIVRDGEGASKFISVHVRQGESAAECKQVAYAIANSPLVKTAMFASDANVGRLLMAIGKAGVPELDASKVSVSLGDERVFEDGGIASGYVEAKGAAIMARDEIDVVVNLARGTAESTVYTSDLSHDYVSINADYRS